LTSLQVYNWFLIGYNTSLIIGCSGYILMLVELLGGGQNLRPLLPKSAPILMLWYGLYFGILGRDCAEVAADRMVSRGSALFLNYRACTWAASPLAVQEIHPLRFGHNHRHGMPLKLALVAGHCRQP
jgi:hypothetical protein